MYNMAELKLHVNARKHLRSQITQWHNQRSSFGSFSSADRASTLALLKDVSCEIKDLNAKIQISKWSENKDEAELETELTACDAYKKKLAECIVLLEQAPLVDYSVDTARSLLKSPVAPLPRFQSRDGEDLDRFLVQFEETLSRFNYPDYDKLLLLKQQVSGRALVLIDSLEIDNQSYTEAKALLQKALASPEKQKFSTIKRMTDMTLPVDRDPYEYVSQMRTITESVKNLKIDVDAFLLYFFWNGLNETFRNHVVQITNKTHPNLKELNDSFFDACERYRNFKSEGKTKDLSHKKVTSFAVNMDIEDDFKKSESVRLCSLCSKLDGKESSHPLFKCTNFNNPADKVSKLEELGACVKCGLTNHNTSQCRFRFRKKCINCSGWHFSFLCTKENSKPKEEPRNVAKAEKTHEEGSKGKVKRKGKVEAKNEVSSSVIVTTDSLPSNTFSESILPTFTCMLENDVMIRVLKDGGCQSNFITEKLAKSQNLKVIRNIDLTVNGFNTSQDYKTRVVEANIKIGDTMFRVEAVCIPSIKIRLKLPRLNEVVKGFAMRGYTLADQRLLESHDELRDIDFILGTCSAHCIMDTNVSFGKDRCSIYSHTPLGVMLLGKVEQILEDLEYLPYHGTFDVNAHCAVAKDDVVKDDLAEKYFCQPNSMPTVFTNDSQTDSLEANVNLSILDDKGELLESELQKATDQILESNCFKFTNYDEAMYDEASSELNEKLVRFTLKGTTQTQEGRLEMPLMWNGKVLHLLGKNRHLSELILRSNLKNLRGNEERITLIDQTLKEQERSGIIERIDNLEDFLTEHPEHSFLPHMPVFKPDRQTTKCRIVFLSNLCEKDKTRPMTLSHNQAMFPGPPLNQKITSAVLHLRFDERILVFDIVKAFNQIALRENDQNKLLFLWFKNIAKKDFSLVAYKNKRLSFGLRCSPTILMLALFKILVLDSYGDSEELRELKKLMYQLFYMDNGAVCMPDSDSLRWAYENLEAIFKPYQFHLQQFLTNDKDLQMDIDNNKGEVTPQTVKLLGMCWNRSDDTLSTRKIDLDVSADTKRKILKSIASQFDVYNFNGPVLNRSRLFMHELQCNKSLGWDDKLSSDLYKNWQNIAKQANSAGEVEVKRFVGKRNGTYRLIAFCDSSKSIYGTVVYIQELETKNVSFIMAKNRIVNKQLECKSIPSLEFHAMSLGAEVLTDLYKELCGASCIRPIKVVDLMLYTDSLVSLSWLNAYHSKLEKMQKRSVFVMNRLERINKLCEICPITFSFVSGVENPADYITRAVSFKQLSKTNYLAGPRFLKDGFSREVSRADALTVVVPNPNVKLVDHVDIQNFEVNIENAQMSEHLIPVDRFSSFHKLVSVHKYVIIFINKLKESLINKNLERYGHLVVTDLPFYRASHQIIMREQRIHFSEVFDYFESKNKLVKNMPNIVQQLNVYPDQEGILRVKSKCNRWKDESRCHFPILLPKHSILTHMIIRDMHHRFSHAGCYSLLAELRKHFWIPHYFSVVKKTLKGCVTCKRFKEHAVKLNQSPYKEFRLSPPNIPFSYVYIDHMGPYFVRLNGKKVKVWILCISCMWSRAINLKLCNDLSTAEFLRAFQLHTFEYGIPQFCVSDLGSQLVAASNVITDFINDPDTLLYFEENGVKPLKFEQFYKGCSKLGSMVESCVKLTKRLIYGSVRNYVLEFRDFEFIVCQTIHMVNRRPVAFKEALRDSVDVPEPITPEKLIHGHELVSINVIPDLQSIPSESDPDWQMDNPPQVILDRYSKLRKVRSKLIECYNNEFMASLVNQAVSTKGRYKPVSHKTLQKGDVVLIKESYTKPINYPMGIVKEVVKNINDEVTGASVLKGKTREVVKRHVTTLIPLLSINEFSDSNRDVLQSKIQEGHVEQSSDNEQSHNSNGPVQRRKAALQSEARTRQMLQ